MFVIQDACRKLDLPLDGLRVVIQGFGNVGANLARFLDELGAVVIAVSDSSGGVLNPNGVDIPAAIARKAEGPGCDTVGR